MTIERISSLEALDAERERWEALERRDPHLTVFTTWRWLRAYFPVTKLRWHVVAVRDGARAVAYLPLASARSPFVRELYLGGNPRADYTGMLVAPEDEAAAIEAFAGAVLRERWDAFHAEDIRDPRIVALLDRLRAAGIGVTETGRTRCLSAPLPSSYDEYLASGVDAKHRVNVRRVERRLAEAYPEFRVTEATAETLDAHVDAVIRCHIARYPGNLRSALHRFGGLFRNAFVQGVLHLVVYWDGDRPIAGAAAFVDELNATYGLYMIGFDAEYARFSPGKGIVGRAIRCGIERGMTRLDFLRGDEPFKAEFAREEHFTSHFRLLRPGLRATVLAALRPRYLALKMAVADRVFGRTG